MITVGRLLAISGHPEMANNVIMSIENNHLSLHSPFRLSDGEIFCLT